ncbi:hypothetical protein SK128_026425 [Halocaridina rubra]|uniref:Ig-like domain-containing protein n=1 Tax=Halocaridina rubra TaxID=373956 RepID=A0AAN9ABB2_HALRR
MLQRRGKVFENVWIQHQHLLEKQLKRSQYHVDLQVISDQLRDLSEQLTRMRGHYGDSLAAATNMQSAFKQFQFTVEMLERRIQTFISTTVKMLGPEDDSGEVQQELAELEKKWSTFQMQVGQSQVSIELSIDFYKLVEEAEDWFKQGSKLLVAVAGDSANIQTPEQAEKLRSRIEIFLQPGEEVQQERINKISSLAFQLYGDTAPKQIEVVSVQHTHMIESFSIIRRNLSMMVENLHTAEDHREKQKKEKEELAASLAAAQAEAEAARLAAAAAEEARKAAEEVARTMSIPVEPVVPERVEIEIQTEAVPMPDEEPPTQDDLPPPKKVKLIDDEPQPMAPIFMTPLVGATVTEGVKFSFECRVIGFPMPEVEWLKDNMSITANPDYKTSFEEGVCTLTIEETFTEDSALFTCKAVNAAGMAETSATLTVKEAEVVEVMAPPRFTKKLVDSTAQEGSSYQLEATVEGHPLPVVSWAKNETCVDESPDYVITYNNGDCVLRFEEVFLEDQAEYSCKATNNLGEDITKAKLTVSAVELSERPKFDMTLSNVMARAGQKFKLECHVLGTPTPTVAWFHNNKLVKETPDCKLGFDGRVATLVMSEAFPKNAGTYTVVAKNSAGEAQCSANVSVKGRIPTETSDSEVTSDVDIEPVKPTIQLALKDTTIKEGKPARLDCVIVGQPEPEVIWYHDDTPVKESSDFKLLFHGDRCSLVIQEAFLEDAGIYRVVAMNSAGEASTACFLNVEPEPELTPPPAETPSVAPRFSQLMTDSHVTEGQAVTLSATVTGQPAPTIAWFREGLPLIPDNELQIHEDVNGHVSAHLYAATLDHTGQYEIVASNCAGTAKCVAYLSIEPRLPTPVPAGPQEPPVFITPLIDASVISGNGVKFEAEVTGQPIPMVSYESTDKEITLEHEESISACIQNGADAYYLGSRAVEEQYQSPIMAQKLDVTSNIYKLDEHPEKEEDNFCEDINILGKKEFTDLVSKICRINLLNPEEENNNVLNETSDMVKDSTLCSDIGTKEEFSQLSKFKNMEVLDADSYSQFMMQNIVVYGPVNNFEQAKNFDQFQKFENIQVMDSSHYATLIVDDYESDKESLVNLGNESDNEEGSDISRTSLAASIRKSNSKFITTGLGQDVQPVKLADLWNLIKDSLPPPDIEPDNSTAQKEDNYNKKICNNGSESELDSGYYSGNFTPSSETGGSNSPASKQSRSVISSAESSKRSSFCDTSLLNSSPDSTSKTDDGFKNMLFDHLSKVSVNDEENNLTKLQLANSKMLNIATETTRHISKELSPLSECSSESDSDSGPDIFYLIHNEDISTGLSSACGNPLKSYIKQKDTCAYRHHLVSKTFRENMWRGCEVGIDQFLCPVSENDCLSLRCSSALSVISEEGCTSDYEEGIASLHQDSLTIPSRLIHTIGNSTPDENSNEFDNKLVHSGHQKENSNSNENSETIDINGNPQEINVLGQAGSNSNGDGEPDFHQTSGQQCISSNDNDNSSLQTKEEERKARRAARLAQLREITKILRSPSKLSNQMTVEALSTPGSSQVNTRAENAEEISDESKRIIQCEMQYADGVLGTSSGPSANKAIQLMVTIAERISRLDLMKVIAEKLKPFLSAGHILLRAFIFPFSQANIIDLTDPLIFDQDYDRTLVVGIQDVTSEATILCSKDDIDSLQNEAIANTMTPALIEAGCYFIILCYHETSTV